MVVTTGKAKESLISKIKKRVAVLCNALFECPFTAGWMVVSLSCSVPFPV